MTPSMTFSRVVKLKSSVCPPNTKVVLFVLGGVNILLLLLGPPPFASILTRRCNKIIIIIIIIIIILIIIIIKEKKHLHTYKICVACYRNVSAKILLFVLLKTPVMWGLVTSQVLVLISTTVMYVCDVCMYVGVL